MSYYGKSCNFSALIGKTIGVVDGLERGSQLIRFNCTDGSVFEMYHDQDCCEYVSVEDVCGDENDLTFAKVHEAWESSSDAPSTDGAAEWTFYNITTEKGHVFIRWYGESNGYYGTGVSFYQTKGGDSD